MFGTDGIRGLANREPITPLSAVKVAMAAAAVLVAPKPWSTRPHVVIGRDTRASGEYLEQALGAGLAAAGVDVLTAGVIPTPAVAYLTRDSGAAFGVVVSASHNPFDDNGIKFFAGSGYKLTDAEEWAIENAFDEVVPGSPLPVGAGVGRIRSYPSAAGQYAGFAVSTVPQNVSLAGRRVVLDCANGAAYHTTPLALRTLGIEVELAHAEPDGYNINAGCGSMHPEVIAERVKARPGAVGIAHDGDADRVLFCDENGEIVDGDELLALAAADLLAQGRLRENTLVATVMSNYGLDAALAGRGAKVLRTGVGDRHVIEAMVERDLNLGGEQSGHLIFRDYVTTGDGLVAALQVLATMASTGRPLCELRKTLRKYPQVQRNVRVREKVPFGEVVPVQTALNAAEAQLAGCGRVLLRYSGTEPKARLLLEGPDQGQLLRLADTLEAALRSSLGA
ncbi:MAG: phosphoglucosamine mutase [Verrucomicrobia bacterium]|nr:phosphoglucosamine mutase [Verrucomicrobiota bacterium]